MYNWLCIGHTRLTHSHLTEYTDPKCTNCTQLLSVKHTDRTYSYGRTQHQYYSFTDIKNIFNHTPSQNILYFIKTCKAGLVLSVTRILRSISCVCMYVSMYVCMCNYSSQTTEPILKIIPANRASYADCYRLLRFEIFIKYDEYFVPESAPLLHRRIFATGTAAAYR